MEDLWGNKLDPLWDFDFDTDSDSLCDSGASSDSSYTPTPPRITAAETVKVRRQAKMPAPKTKAEFKAVAPQLRSKQFKRSIKDLDYTPEEAAKITKERRKTRNKAAAVRFRENRKAYLRRLEDEVAQLREEVRQLKALVKK